MIQAQRLGHIVLKVRDAGKSKDFYTRALGLKVAHEDLERGTVFLSFGREHHELALFQLATGEPPSPAQPGLHHMAWRLGSFEELRAAYQELKAMGFGWAAVNATAIFQAGARSVDAMIDQLRDLHGKIRAEVG